MPFQRYCFLYQNEPLRFVSPKKTEPFRFKKSSGWFCGLYLMKLRLFLFEEYKYVEKYPALYSEIKERCIPSKERAQNTVAIKLRILQAFYTELEDRDEIDVSAFRKLDKNRRKVVMKESYDAPVYLLQEAKEAFLLQCTFGSHIDDFKSLNMDKVLSVPRGFLTYAICLRKH